MEILLRSERSYSNGQIALFLACFACLFLFFIGRMALINADLLVFILASLCFIPIFTAWGYIFVETYTFYQDRIAVFDHKGKLLKELRYDDIEAWNEIRTRHKSSHFITLLVKSGDAALKIEAAKYRNYWMMVKLLRSKSPKQDSSFEQIRAKQRVTNPIYRDLFVVAGLSLLLLNICFFIAVAPKERTAEKLSVKGEIDSIDFVRRKNGSYVNIKLKNQVDIVYKVFEREDVEAFRLYSSVVAGSRLGIGVPDSIELQVSKSDYDWQLNNRTIKKIRLGWPAELEVLDYELYSLSRKKGIQLHEGVK
jgi:hypothetical protein